MDEKFNEIICRLDAHFKALAINYMIVGAKARDIIAHKAGIPAAKRKTNDVDFGIMVEGWDELKRVKDHLFTDKDISDKSYIKTKVRFNFKGTLFDVVPFGKIEENGKIIWPPDNDPVMTMIGYKEAYENSFEIDIQGIMVKVISPEMLFALKIVSWDENPTRERDAYDMAYIIDKYGKIDPDAEETVYDHYPHFNDITGYELGHSILILMGERIRLITSHEHQQILNRVLISKVERLANNMVESEVHDRDQKIEEYQVLLSMIHKGLNLG